MLIPQPLPLPPAPAVPEEQSLRELETFTARVDRLRLRPRPVEQSPVALPPAEPVPPREGGQDPGRDGIASALPRLVAEPDVRPAPPCDEPVPAQSDEWLARLTTHLESAAPARLSVQLAPPELGTLRVILEERDGRLRARLITPNRTTAGLLRAHRHALLELLGSEAEVDIELGSDFLDSGPDERHPSHQEGR